MNPVIDAEKVTVTLPVAAMLLTSIGFSASAQILLKYGMSVASVQTALSNAGSVRVATAVAASPAVWCGLLLYGLSALVWLFVLARLDVSIAYAFVALGFLATMALAVLVLGEPLTTRKLAGTMLLVGGIWLVAGRR